jgi:hypothetical protein
MKWEDEEVALVLSMSRTWHMWNNVLKNIDIAESVLLLPYTTPYNMPGLQKISSQSNASPDWPTVCWMRTSESVNTPTESRRRFPSPISLPFYQSGAVLRVWW